MVLTGKDGSITSHYESAAARKRTGLRNLFRDSQGLQSGLQHSNHIPILPDRFRDREHRLVPGLLPVPYIGHHTCSLLKLTKQAPVTFRRLLGPQPSLQLLQGHIFYHIVPVLQIKLVQISVQGILGIFRDNLFNQAGNPFQGIPGIRDGAVQVTFLGLGIRSQIGCHHVSVFPSQLPALIVKNAAGCQCEHKAEHQKSGGMPFSN